MQLEISRAVCSPGNSGWISFSVPASTDTIEGHRGHGSLSPFLKNPAGQVVMGGLAGRAAVAQCLGSLQQLSVLAATWSLPTHSLRASVTQEPRQASTRFIASLVLLSVQDKLLHCWYCCHYPPPGTQRVLPSASWALTVY